jgi:magnesium-transporting ATPase (P-type)
MLAKYSSVQHRGIFSYHNFLNKQTFILISVLASIIAHSLHRGIFSYHNFLNKQTFILISVLASIIAHSIATLYHLCKQFGIPKCTVSK